METKPFKIIVKIKEVVTMARGFMGKMLWVDLSKKGVKDEVLDEKLCRDFLGGFGLGARILFSRQEAGVDPLGPENILGITTGVLTGTDALGGSRYTMVGKSPLTGPVMMQCSSPVSRTSRYISPLIMVKPS